MKLLFSSPLKRQAQALYVAVVAQARQPFLYKDFAIPDTLDGRFDAIILHMFPVIRRLKRTPEARMLSLARLLQEAFISDMDRSLREMGVGDTGVGHRIKKMGGALGGRLRAYETAVGDEAAMYEALVRNVYRGVLNDHVPALAAYVAECVAQIDQQAPAEIASGKPCFAQRNASACSEGGTLSASVAP
jgi:cytochrome b pre-mRNA-processing protein 3